MRKLITALVVCFVAGPALGEEVLYCTDKSGAILIWDQGSDVSRLAALKEERFTIIVVNNKKRKITRSGAKYPSTYSCKPPSATARLVAPNSMDAIICEGEFSMWIFKNNNYVRSYLWGHIVGGIDRNIWVAYGTCAKF